MTPEERANKIELYGKAYDLLMEGLKEFPAEMWHFKPSADRWSVHEIVVHITDSEANSYVRCRRFIAEPGLSLMAYDESGWARDLYYQQQSTEVAIQLFRWLRQSSYNLITSLPDPAVWSNVADHPENGPMTLDDWLDTYARHVPEHLEQMQEVYADWLKHKAA